MREGGLRFDCRIAPNGYVWWYIDALSDDGQYGITAIAFIGSVFSPYYAWSRRKNADTNPLNHCAVNVALYGPQASRWSMTERGSSQVSRDASSLTIGTSSLRWTGAALEISVDERCAPIPRRIHGLIRIIPAQLTDHAFALDEAGLHRWTPFAPRARVEVLLSKPGLRWAGTGYFDSNQGEEPLEDGFADWTWSRADLGERTVVVYDTTPRHGAPRSLALEFADHRVVQPCELPSRCELPKTRWRLGRCTRVDAGHQASVTKTLEDAPFYSRSILDTRLLGLRAPAIHESLSLDRFHTRWVKALLPFRMPRIAF